MPTTTTQRNMVQAMLSSALFQYSKVKAIKTFLTCTHMQEYYIYKCKQCSQETTKSDNVLQTTIMQQ